MSGICVPVSIGVTQNLDCWSAWNVPPARSGRCCKTTSFRSDELRMGFRISPAKRIRKEESDATFCGTNWDFTCQIWDILDNSIPQMLDYLQSQSTLTVVTLSYGYTFNPCISDEILGPSFSQRTTRYTREIQLVKSRSIFSPSRAETSSKPSCFWHISGVFTGVSSRDCGYPPEPHQVLLGVPADLRRDSPFDWNTGTVTIWFGGFHSHEGSPKRILFYNGKSYQNGWFRSTLILGNIYFCWG